MGDSNVNKMLMIHVKLKKYGREVGFTEQTRTTVSCYVHGYVQVGRGRRDQDKERKEGEEKSFPLTIKR